MALFDSVNNEDMVAKALAGLLNTVTHLLKMVEPLLKDAVKQAKEAAERRRTN